MDKCMRWPEAAAPRTHQNLTDFFATALCKLLCAKPKIESSRGRSSHLAGQEPLSASLLFAGHGPPKTALVTHCKGATTRSPDPTQTGAPVNFSASRCAA